MLRRRRWQTRRRLLDASTSPGEDDGADTATDSPSAVEPIQVVVARGVTSDEVDAIPDEWLGGVRLSLLDDGTLVVREAASQHQRQRHSQLVVALGQVRHESLFVSGDASEFTSSLPTAEVPLLVEEDFTREAATRLPRFMVHTKIACSFPDAVRLSRQYFTEIPTLEGVVLFKMFPPLVDGINGEHIELPAVAIGFTINRERTCMTTVAAASFGTSFMHKSVMTTLRAGVFDGPTRILEAFEGYVQDVRYPDGLSRWIPLTQALVNMRSQEPPLFCVPIGQTVGDVWFNLYDVLRGIVPTLPSVRQLLRDEGVGAE